MTSEVPLHINVCYYSILEQKNTNNLFSNSQILILVCKVLIISVYADKGKKPAIPVIEQHPQSRWQTFL